MPFTVQSSYNLGLALSSPQFSKYGEHFNRVNEFKAPRFAATGAPRAAGRMRVSPMTQHA